MKPEFIFKIILEHLHLCKLCHTPNRTLGLDSCLYFTADLLTSCFCISHSYLISYDVTIQSFISRLTC
ncbi:hypothetical protein Hdeb2414_s0004g00127921 [Helianthus debilis subsp. tardiflorus]